MTRTRGRTTTAKRIVAVSAVALVLTGGFGVPPAAAAHVGCGDVITADTVLDSDVGPCKKGGLIIAADNIILDLNGHTVSGGRRKLGDGAGIFLDGVSGVTVMGGTVNHFDAGVVIEEGLGNVIADMEASDNVGSGGTDFGDGIVISSSSENVIRDSRVLRNGPFDGIGVIVTATDPAGTANGNVIKNNLVIDNNIGFSDTFNSNIGIRLEPGTNRTTVRNNLVQGSGLDGIQVFGNSLANEVQFNLVKDNGDLGVPTIRFGDGIRVGSTDNHIEDNLVADNAGNGIFVFGTQNRIRDNDTFANATAPIVGDRPTFDLRDSNEDCDANRWRDNTFETADPECTTTQSVQP